VAVALIERFRDRLPVTAGTPVISLGEGSTPLLAVPRLSELIGVELRIKWEGVNPSGSFKDRGMTVAVSKALQHGAAGVVCASTGNTAASAAAYAARAGIRCLIVVPAGAVAPGKVAQALAVGAELREVAAGGFPAALDEAARIAVEDGFALVNSLNPDRIEGQKTAAFEVAEELGRAPDVLALPYGGGGNTCAYARGFAELGARPRLVAGEAAERAVTAASAIRITEPAHRAEAERAVAASRGEIVQLSDDEILEARRELATLEGIFCEPASAAGLAALKRNRHDGLVVCVVTGHGLKDP
jgi:threonine synthase